MSTALRLAGKTILITAAAQGIGRASALACAQEGAKVIATDINMALLQDLPSLSDRIQVAQLDVCDPEQIKALAARTPALDVLFNCAGMVHHGTVLECPDDDWNLSFNLNVTSMHRMIRAFLPAMLERAKTTRSASIINTASIASSIKGLPNRYAYGATKAAVIGLTKAMAADFVGQGLRCNTLCPGTVDTPSLRGRIAASPDPVAAEKNFIARQPIGRLATVDDITPMVVFLASDESRYITGQNLSVDGGISI